MKAFLRCFFFLMFAGIAANPIGELMPRAWFKPKRFPYRSYRWEKEGRIYEKLGVQKWKDHVPDMSKILPYMFRKKVTKEMGSAGVLRLIQETCVAELIHQLLMLAGFGCLMIWEGTGGICLVVIWIAGNMPDIVIQRYNRPKLMTLYERFRINEEKRWRRMQDGTPRVLILTCNTGEGHNSTASAIRCRLEEESISCDIRDTLSYRSKTFSRLVSGGHAFIYRHLPFLFSGSYVFLEKHPSLQSTDSAIYRLFMPGVDKLYCEIANGGYNVIVCPHVFPNFMMNEIHRRFPLPLRSVFVATDYTCSPGVGVGDADYCCIPAESLRAEFIRKEVRQESIRVTGIPVSHRFRISVSASEAKASFGIPADRTHLLMMCGSMGCGPMFDLAERIEKQVDASRSAVTILCGTNVKLLRRMQARFGKSPAFRILGFTKEMPLLMDSADLYLTKPGGLSTTEAAVKHLPMLLVNAVAGCEDYNLRFMAEKGCAVTATGVSALAELCLSLLSDPDRLKQMSESAKDVVLQDADSRILTVIREAAAQAH